MKKKFGIISGAGPMAGALLYQQVITMLQKKGAWRDSDFPEILLLNYPFSDMLSGEMDNKKIHNELTEALAKVCGYVDYVYIACQTLHGFLEPHEIEKYKVVSLITLTREALAKTEKEVVVVASKTSREFNLHPNLLGIQCEYVEHDQAEHAINEILAGNTISLDWLEMLAVDKSVILGCTEFSVATAGSLSGFVDPIKLAAEDIVRRFNCTESNIECVIA